MGSCKLLPHGTYSLVPAVLTTMGWMTSLFQDGCNYAKLSNIDSSTVFDQLATTAGVPYLQLGLSAYRQPMFDAASQTWQPVFTGQCLEYPSIVVQDAAWKVARVFDFMALVLGGGGTFFLWFSTCCVFSRGTWKWTGVEVLLASLFQVLAFVWFATSICQNDELRCSLFWGSKADVISALFWLAAGLLICSRYPQPMVAMTGPNGDGDGIIMTRSSIRRRRSSSSSSRRPSVQVHDALTQSALSNSVNMSAMTPSSSSAAAPTTTTTTPRRQHPAPAEQDAFTIDDDNADTMLSPSSLSTQMMAGEDPRQEARHRRSGRERQEDEFEDQIV